MKTKKSIKYQVSSIHSQVVRSIICILLTFNFITLQTFNSFSQGIAINPTGAAADALAVLDVSSTNRGLRIPRVALTDTASPSPVTNPVNSLLVFDTVLFTNGIPGFYYWDAAHTQWVRLVTGITTTDITNWNAAYGWGDHAGLYRPISYVPAWSEITSNPFSFNSVANNQLPKYNSTSGKWENWTPDFLTSSSGVSSIAGTANQITASASTGAVTLSLPSAITGLTSVTSTGFTGALTGNASSATALQTARNIFGISFNGTADIGSALGTGAYATIANYAPIASPTFTGTPAAPTAAVGTNTTQIATTAFVLANTTAPITAGDAIHVISKYGTTASASYALVGGKVYIRVAGTYRIKLTLVTNAGANTTYGYLYKNGVSYGTEKSVYTGGYGEATFDYDMACVVGDYFQPYIKCNFTSQGGGAYVSLATDPSVSSMVQVRCYDPVSLTY